nr:MAG TPA: neurotoxin [Caudoviricetes sp.]
MRKPTSTVWVFNCEEQWVRASQSKRWRNTFCSRTRLSMSSSRLTPNA